MADEQIEFFEIFPWDKNFETGIAQIDEQHQELVHILNRLAAHLANRSKALTLNKVFDELASYADYHFKSEEKIWSKYFGDDDWCKEHEHSHGSFIEKVIEIKNSDNKTLDEVVYEIVSFLSQWLAYHILDSDKRMSMAITALESGKSTSEAKMIANEEMNGSMKVLVEAVLSMYDSLSNRTLDLMREKTLRKQAEEALLASEEQWQFVLGDGNENIWDWSVEQGKINFSEQGDSIFHILDNDESEKDITSTIHPADIAKIRKSFNEHCVGKSQFFSQTYRKLRSNGSWSWILSRGKIVSKDKAGKPLRVIGTHTDVTERELAGLIYEHGKQGMFVMDANKNIISISPAFSQITGYCSQDIVDKQVSLFTCVETEEQSYQQMWRAIDSDSYWSGEFLIKCKSGESLPIFISINTVKGPSGEEDNYIGLFSDLTEKKNADELIEVQANFDTLTNLPNRNLFSNLIQQEIRRSHRSKLAFALLFIDLDHFKQVNDTLGHEIGDLLLVEAAHRIAAQVRETDSVSRFGGDEFTVLLSDIEKSTNIDKIAQNIIDTLSEPFDLNGKRAFVSASVGITLCPNDSDNFSQLYKNADQAMFRAKKLGRGCFCYFTAHMQEAAIKRQILMNELRDALSLNQFQLYYQPIITLASGEINKAEALIRWCHPERGIISPVDFIPLAEESGLIIEIGNWVFEEAAKQALVWQQKYGSNFQISVNKSPIQFREKNNYSQWLSHLEAIKLPSKHLVFEITESLLMESDIDVAMQLVQLRKFGIEIALDDFGTGYSSLSYIKDFQIDYIKIDQSFVLNMSPNSQELALCEAMIVMAHKLGIKVIAEGIELDVHRQLLTEIGCDYGQGYLFSKPVAADKFELLLDR